MKEKKLNCKYCGSEMQPKTTRQEFCSTKCRVYWNRENPKITENDLIKIAVVASNKTQGGDKSEKTATTTKSSVVPLNSLKMAKPEKLPDESGIDYAIRLAEWKESQKK